jgi:hypothetical protein
MLMERMAEHLKAHNEQEASGLTERPRNAPPGRRCAKAGDVARAGKHRETVSDVG